MKYIARYTVKVGRRIVKIWIRPEWTSNLSSYATRFESAKAAEDHVWNLNVPNMVVCDVFEVQS